MVRKATLVSALAALFLLGAPHAGDNGPWKVGTWQFGVQTADLQRANPFEIRGEGFHASVLPVKVCVSSSYCELATVDRGGNFTLPRSITNPGAYQVTVFQARDMQIHAWRQRAIFTVNVTE